MAVSSPTLLCLRGSSPALTFPSPAHTLLLHLSDRGPASPCLTGPPTRQSSQSPCPAWLCEFWKALSGHMMALESCQMLLQSWRLPSTRELGSGLFCFCESHKAGFSHGQQPPENLNIVSSSTLPNQWLLVFDAPNNQPSFLSMQPPHCPGLSSLCTQYISVLNSLPVAVNPKLHTQRCKKD